MTTPCRSITIPLYALGAAAIWTTAVMVRGFAVDEAGEGWVTPFSLQLAATQITAGAIVATVAILFKRHRQKVRGILAEHRDLVIERVDELVVRRIADAQASVIEAVALQMTMREVLDEPQNVARFPTPRG